MTPDTLILAVLVYSVGPALLAAWLAGERGREPLVWAIVGLLLGPMAVIAVGLAPVPVGAPAPSTSSGGAFTRATPAPKPQRPPEDTWRA